jgi:parvulin-like peptidyl-prolyl isomerase
MILYGIVLLYLIGDLQLFNGPLNRAIDKRRNISSAEYAIEHDWVAVVNGESITLARLARAVDAHLHVRGKARSDLSATALRHIRGATLQQLIDDLVVAQHAAGRKHTVSEEKVDRMVARFESQFKDPEQLEQRSAAQHLDPEQRRARLRQQVIQTDWLESHLAEAPQVGEDIARQWFDDNRAAGAEGGFVAPEVIRARHIFLSSLGNDTPELEQKVRDLHRQLSEEHADFSQLAASYSQDQRSKIRGGDLNWFSRARMPADFYEPVAKLQPGQLSDPFRTSLGWHIVEVTDRRPAREASFEDMRDEIIAYLESEDRRQKIDDFVENLRRASIITVFPEQL